MIDASRYATVQSAVDDAQPGDVIYFPWRRRGYVSSSSVIVPHREITFQLEPGVSLLWEKCGPSPLGTAGLSILGNSFRMIGGKLVGPRYREYVANESLIEMAGQAGNHARGLRLEGVELFGSGAYGIRAKWADDIRITDCRIRDCGYSGATFLSCNHGRFRDNWIENINPGTANNMYGVSLTHDSKGYNLDPAAGTKLAVNPFCIDWIVEGNTVLDVGWQGIDCHGAYDTSILNNRMYACRSGIACSASSGDAANYAGWNNRVVGNLVDSRWPDGKPSEYQNVCYGINVNGGPTARHRNVEVSGNCIYGYGVASNGNSGAIQALFCEGGNIHGNVVENWNGNGILFSASSNLVVANNIGKQMAKAADTEGCFLCHATADGTNLRILGNIVTAGSGTPARYGFRFPRLVAAPYLCGNDFHEASVGQLIPSAAGYAGPDKQ